MGQRFLICLCCTAAVLTVVTSQSLPRRLQIPGAIPLGAPVQDVRPLPYRRVVQQQSLEPVPQRIRSRPPPQQLAQAIPIRPVFEDTDDDNGPLSKDEVARLQNIPLVSGPPPQQLRPTPQPQRQLVEDDEEENIPQQRAQPQPIQFRPAPVVRLQAQPIQVRQPVPQRVAQTRPRPQPVAQNNDDDERRHHQGRTKKPPVKILRKYREDNPDGSITWGFENDDGTFKEETIGADCVIRGKYGYIDPDGNRREYSYETGLRCDLPQEEDDDDLPEEPVRGKPQPQIKPRPIQNLPPIRLQ